MLVEFIDIENDQVYLSLDMPVIPRNGDRVGIEGWGDFSVHQSLYNVNSDGLEGNRVKVGVRKVEQPGD